MAERVEEIVAGGGLQLQMLLLVVVGMVKGDYCGGKVLIKILLLDHKKRFLVLLFVLWTL